MKASLDIPEKINHTDDVYMRCPDGTGVGITEGSTEGTGEGNMDGLKEGEGVGMEIEEEEIVEKLQKEES